LVAGWLDDVSPDVIHSHWGKRIIPMRNLTPNTPATIMALMIDSSDHIAGKDGLTLVVTISKNGGAFAAVDGGATTTPRGSGWYAVTLTANDINVAGELAYHITAAGADPYDGKDCVGAVPANILQVVGTDQTACDLGDLLDNIVQGEWDILDGLSSFNSSGVLCSVMSQAGQDQIITRFLGTLNGSATIGHQLQIGGDPASVPQSQMNDLKSDIEPSYKCHLVTACSVSSPAVSSIICKQSLHGIKVGVESCWLAGNYTAPPLEHLAQASAEAVGRVCMPSDAVDMTDIAATGSVAITNCTIGHGQPVAMANTSISLKVLDYRVVAEQMVTSSKATIRKR
jgi:hypothetical protein